MSRIAERFNSLRQKGHTGLIPFLTAGDPRPAETVPLMHAMVGAGADIIELGVPFSDPMADGPVIQRASERALAHHVNLAGVLKMVREFRLKDNSTPVVLMGYLNPIERMGYEAFGASAKDAGVDGVLTVDLPPEEAAELVGVLRSQGIDPIFLIAPTSTIERIALISQLASGFVYYVSLKGVTGAANLDIDSIEGSLDRIRGVTSLPVGVGFGIKDGQSAARVARVADAVIIGSTIVQRIEALASEPGRLIDDVAGILGDMRKAMNRRER